MALRPGDWKARAALAAVIGAGFLLTGAGLAAMERARERRQLQQRAFVFAQLSTHLHVLNGLLPLLAGAAATAAAVLVLLRRVT